MPIVSLSEWDYFLQNYPHAHLLQRGEWGELKSFFGWNAVRMISGDIGVQILFRKLLLGFTIGYIPKPVMSNKSLVTSNEIWGEVDFICNQQRAIFLKIEPDIWESDDSSRRFSVLPPKSGPTGVLREDFGLHLSQHNIQPPRTIIVDIRGSEEEILARMKQKTRYNIRLAEKKGVTMRIWSDIPAFYKMMMATGNRDDFSVHSFKYYERVYELLHPKGLCEILVAEYEGKPLAALLVAKSGIHSYYLYGASTDEERNRMPTYLVQWEAMKWARSHGCEDYDLWGVPDEDEATLEANFEKRQAGLWGVYRFKRGFGGELKRAAQALDRVYNPLLYKLYLWRMAGRENG